MSDNPQDYNWTSSGKAFVTKDSGARQEFPSGSVRDTSVGKPRPDLISPRATLRHAALMSRGAERYGERNWELGQPVSRYLESLLRHILMYQLGERTEDHLAAARFNVDGMIHFEGTSFDDINGGEPLTVDWPNEEPEAQS